MSMMQIIALNLFREFAFEGYQICSSLYTSNIWSVCFCQRPGRTYCTKNGHGIVFKDDIISVMNETINIDSVK